MITFKHYGDLSKTKHFLEKAQNAWTKSDLEKYGKRGVEALSAATPKDTGLTSAAWYYDIFSTSNGYEIAFYNSNTNNGVNIAIILQYGHATKNGGYVQGRDYINPAMQQVFDEIAEEAWKEVTSQ